MIRFFFTSTGSAYNIHQSCEGSRVGRDEADNSGRAYERRHAHHISPQHAAMYYNQVRVIPQISHSSTMLPFSEITWDARIPSGESFKRLPSVRTEGRFLCSCEIFEVSNEEYTTNSQTVSLPKCSHRLVHFAFHWATGLIFSKFEDFPKFDPWDLLARPNTICWRGFNMAKVQPPAWSRELLIML